LSKKQVLKAFGSRVQIANIMSEPLVTTVIPTFRRPTTLRRAIHSVLNQTFSDFRICVYDNASGDQTADVVEDFRRRDSRVEYVCRPTNIGMFANFVDGADRVETPFFSFLSDDDVMLPHFLETAVAGFRRHPEAAISVLTTIRITDSGLALDAPILGWREGLLPPPEGMLSILRYGNPDLPGLLIRRDILREIRFDETTGPPSDLDFELQVAARFPVVVSRRPGGILLVHKDAATSASCLDWVWPGFPRILSKLVNDQTIPHAARREAAKTLSSWLKRGLFMRGVIRSATHGRWDDAEEAAKLLLRECRWQRAAGVIRPARAIGQNLPGTRTVFRTFLAARSLLRILCHLDLQWRFRTYCKLVRA
jgi:hypothetical protein